MSVPTGRRKGTHTENIGEHNADLEPDSDIGHRIPRRNRGPQVFLSNAMYMPSVSWRCGQSRSADPSAQ
ncbi:MAG TPA: hypothetical protein PKL68_07555, partial [Actinomycetota bacterium]|nr:hypothetical protein [Actinomycetota bacterium]